MPLTEKQQRQLDRYTRLSFAAGAAKMKTEFVRQILGSIEFVDQRHPGCPDAFFREVFTDLLDAVDELEDAATGFQVFADTVFPDENEQAKG